MMEEKRKETGNQPAASYTSVDDATPTKISETAAAAEPPPPRRRGGNKRKANGGSASGSQTSSAKRQAREKLSAASQVPIHNGPCTRARQPPSPVPVSAAPDVKNEVVAAKPECRGGDAVKATEETTVVDENWEALEAKIEAEYEAIRSRDAGAHIVPIPAGWFSWTKVHPLEEQALPSFFNGKSGKKTPEIYMEIRNGIMRKFHANPSTLIELKDLSELSVGEPETRQEVMAFLDHWGLINYHPFPDSDATIVNRNEEVAQKDLLVDKLYQFGSEQSSPRVIPRSNATTPAVPPGFLPESFIAEDLARPEGPDVEYHCNSCSADCSRKRYHNQKQADFDLCSECFNNRKFDSGMSPTDFILMEPAEAAGVSGGKWTDQETLLLLEALELYKENWTEIAEHVATKTKAQCILHFVQMPIEDTFMESDDEVVASVKENTDPATASNDSKDPKEATPETTETMNGTNENQPESQPEPEPQPSPMEISMPEDASKKVTREADENCALKALKEAFEVVGCFTTPGTQFSFAEAGNPVMALAAFLVRLVEPNSATALARSSLKSVSGNSSSMKLAARHCFLLEEPPEDEKKSAGSDSAVEKTIEMDTLKTDKQENQKDEKSDSVLGNGEDHNNKDDKDSAEEEKEPSNSNDGGCMEKSRPVKDSDVTGTHEEGLTSLNETTNSDSLKEVTKDAKETDDVMANTETGPSSAKEADDKASAVIGTHEEGTLSSEHDTKDFQTIEAKSGKELDDVTLREEFPSSSLKKSDEKASDERTSQDSKAEKDTVAVPDSGQTDNTEQEQLIVSKSDENEIDTGKKETEGGKTDNQEVEDASKTNGEHNIDKLKRAAATAISAAAVKAKLLADQEEDQIRHLATLLIEKQLHKLETKLAFFNEMESVVMRVREQMERSKQRLYQERAQIIAARLGLPASSSRQMQQSLPINRVAMGFANSMAKSPMSMTSQRPPISRSMMTMGPPTSNTHVPPAAAGNPVRPTNKDSGSSVEMK